MRVIGAITTVLGSLNPAALCVARMPTTVNGLPETEIVWPRADPVGKRVVASVEPITATLAEVVTSAAVNAAPESTFVVERPKYPASVPMIETLSDEAEVDETV